MDERFKLLEERLEEQSNNTQFLIKMMKEMKESSSTSENLRNASHDVNSNRAQGMIPTLQFPSFDGTNRRIWIKNAGGISLCVR